MQAVTVETTFEAFLPTEVDGAGLQERVETLLARNPAARAPDKRYDLRPLVHDPWRGRRMATGSSPCGWPA